MSHLAKAVFPGETWLLHQVHVGEENPVMSFFIVRGVPSRMVEELFTSSFFEEARAASGRFPMATAPAQDRLFDAEAWEEDFHGLLDHVYANMDLALEQVDPDDVPEDVIAMLDERMSDPAEGATDSTRPPKH